MQAVFPTVEWLKEFEEKLISNEHYAQIANMAQMILNVPTILDFAHRAREMTQKVL